MTSEGHLMSRNLLSNDPMIQVQELRKWFGSRYPPWKNKRMSPENWWFEHDMSFKMVRFAGDILIFRDISCFEIIEIYPGLLLKVFHASFLDDFFPPFFVFVVHPHNFPPQKTQRRKTCDKNGPLLGGLEGCCLCMPLWCLVLHNKNLGKFYPAWRISSQDETVQCLITIRWSLVVVPRPGIGLLNNTLSIHGLFLGV